jgi:CheY-like chemotaxis protein
VDIPRPAQRVEPQAKPAQQPEQAAKRVLIVDDNIDACETLAMMLELLGQQTRQAHEGVGALKAAQEYQPEIIFMDIGLPGLTGHEVAERMRGELGMKETYIVALSGYGTEEDRRKSLVAGFDNHYVKPLDPSTLPGILAECDKRQGKALDAMIRS